MPRSSDGERRLRHKSSFAQGDELCGRLPTLSFRPLIAPRCDRFSRLSTLCQILQSSPLHAAAAPALNSGLKCWSPPADSQRYNDDGFKAQHIATAQEVQPHTRS